MRVDDLISRATAELPGADYRRFIRQLNAGLSRWARVGKHPWRWYRRVDRVTVPAPYLDGDVTVTNGSASVTGAGTAWTADMVGWWFRVEQGGPVYRVEAVTSGTALTLDRVYAEDTAAGIGYRLWADGVDLPADVDVIRFVRDGATGRMLREVTDRNAGGRFWVDLSSFSWDTMGGAQGDYFVQATSAGKRLLFWRPVSAGVGMPLDVFVVRKPQLAEGPQSEIDAPDYVVECIYYELMQHYAASAVGQSAEARTGIAVQGGDFRRRKEECFAEARTMDARLSDPHMVNRPGGLWGV